MKIVQVMNALDVNDAVSMHLLELDRQLVALGHRTAIVSLDSAPSLASRRLPPDALADLAPDLVLFHYAGFTPLLGALAGLPCRRGVIYHNVTPSRYFAGMPQTQAFTERGRAQLGRLARAFDFALADSTFNAGDLAAAGFAPVRVLPIPWETSGLDAVTADPRTLAERTGPEVRLLVAGRVAPHKGVHHALRAMPEILRRVGPARLSIVGRMSGYEPYVRELRRETRRRGLGEAVELLGEVTPARMRALFETSDALLVLSEHEGFCMPIAEAIGLGVPVVAAPAGAVEETMGDAGVLLRDRTPEAVAAGVATATRDRDARARIAAAGAARRAELSRDRSTERLAEALAWACAVPEREHAPSLPPASVVVCTYNRHAVLRQALLGLRRLDYPSFEVVVVNGPSDDGTDAVLAEFPDIKRVDNPRRNLSVSRNLGIAASAGEIVAFLDDDALPSEGWLRGLAAAFEDPAVGGAGGRVWGAGGVELQFDRGIIDRGGLPRSVRLEPADHNTPRAEWYNIVMGTNSCFRRAALADVGGYDENYEYYHDESDLCVRLIEAGWRVEHVDGADVWHEFERSHIRRGARNIDWRVIVRNTIYFYFKLNRWRSRPWDQVRPLKACAVHGGIFTRWFVHGEMSFPGFLKACLRFVRGLAEGYAKGWLVAPRRHLARRSDRRGAELLPYRRAGVRHGRDRLGICLISQQYAPDEPGGIGVYTEQLAEALVEDGHRVTVVADGPRRSTVWRNGVRVVRVPPRRPPPGIPRSFRVTRRNVARSLAVDAFVRRAIRRDGIRIIESPIWDAEGFATALDPPVPFVLRLMTPMAMAIETQGWPRTADYDLACAMEWRMLERADGVVDPSGTILDTLAERWNVRPGNAVVARIPYGVAVPDLPAPTQRPAGEVRYLFVGRFERRKGIDLLVAAIPGVLDRVPGAVFDLAGGDPDGRPEDVLRGLSPAHAARVRVHGRVDDARREDLYRACDVFVAPSRYESFGLVYLEAMAWAKPCVACDVGGAKVVVGHERAGLLAPPEDAAGLADALVRLGTDHALRERLGRQGRAIVEAEHTVRAMARASVDFYERVLSRTPAVAAASR